MPDQEGNMSIKYSVVSGVVFGFIAIAQSVRALRQLPVHVGDFEIPVWLSWVAVAIAGSLCVWAFRGRN
ncbi:MAG TPA: hypothetical protein VIK49_02460 [Steroidobacteraceae bacterium]